MDKSVFSIMPILSAARRALMKRKNVVATSIGYKVTAGKKAADLSIICSVDKKQSPSQLSSYENEAIIVGVARLNTGTES